MDALRMLRKNHLRGDVITSSVSGVLTTKEELIRFFDRNVPSLDIITTKSFQVVPTPGNREPVVCSPKAGDFGNSVGLRNPGMEAAIAGLEELRKEGLRALLNVSLAADCISIVVSSSTGQVSLFRRGQMIPLNEPRS